MFSKEELKIRADELILMALKEDITSEDITTNAIVKEDKTAQAELICKQDGVIAGLLVFLRVFELLDSNTTYNCYFKDGDKVKKGDLICVVHASVKTILMAERTALNFLQRMSGIATYTNSVVELLKDSNTKLLDTRKTTPNMRIFEKYAVKMGGGNNHRFNLSDGILIKDNHIEAALGVSQAISYAKEYAPFVRKIEVEVENIDMVKEALEAGADIIMLDNMDIKTIEEAVNLIDGRAKIECSGNITRENIERLVRLNIDYISSGALTHSAPALDFSLKNLKY